MSAPSAESEATSNAATKEDYDEFKENVKEIVKILRSLAPQPGAAGSKRVFRDGSSRFNELMAIVRPTPDRLTTFAEVLSSMFIRNKEGKFTLWGKELYVGSWNPAFANKDRLRTFLMPDQHVSVGSISDESIDNFRKYIVSRKAEARAYYGGHPTIDRHSNSWEWNTPDNDGHVMIFYVGGNHPDDKCKVHCALNDEHLSFKLPKTTFTSGHGILCLINAPVREGGLDFSWVNLVFAQLSRWNYTNSKSRILTDGKHFDSVMYFLAVFAGFRPTRKERLSISRQSNLDEFTFYRRHLQVHFRYFTAVQELMKCGKTGGLRCLREQGKVLSNTAGAHLYYEERRISVFGLLSIEGVEKLPAFYSVLALGETAWGYKLGGYDLNWRPGLEGTLAFQVAVLRSVDIWEIEWNRVLDQISNCLHIQLEDTLSEKKIKEWMFDEDFKRSQQYFTILQTLRIFGECIGTPSDELRELDDLFLRQSDFPMSKMSSDELQVLRSNWELVRKTQKRAEESLLNRISNKTEEVKSLRDGLFNASSLLEAQASSEMAKKSTAIAEQSADIASKSSKVAEKSLVVANESSIMGRYVLVFTVVTVLYLPPSFISTVFALDIFKKDLSQTKWEYKVALVSVSLVTYAVALVAVIAVKGGKKLKRGDNNL